MDGELTIIWNKTRRSGETCVWCGRPEYGRRFHQVLGDESYLHWGTLIVALTTLLVILLLFLDGRWSGLWAASFATFLTATYGLYSYWIASSRQYVLSTLYYFVTEKRAYVCRSGKNHFLREKIYVASFDHKPTSLFPILDSRPYKSIQIGTLLSADAMQPVGFGLNHPGRPYLESRLLPPVTFENLKEAKNLRLTFIAIAAECQHTQLACRD